MIKVLGLILTFTVFFISCMEQVPPNRPTFSSKNVEVDPDPIVEPEALEIPTRPTGAIVLQTDHCACQNGESIALGTCAQTCASKPNTENELLYFNAEPTTAITLDIYQDISGWCKRDIIDPNTGEAVNAGAAACVIEAIDENGGRTELPFEPGAGAKSFAVDVSVLNFNNSYRITIVEVSSGARSSTIQLRKIKTNDRGIEGPLALMPVNEFACMINRFEDPDEPRNITDSDRTHFYFVSETRPEPLPKNTGAYCHDKQKQETPTNSPLLEEKAGAFSVWNRNDPRFFDLDGDDEIDIHNIIAEEVERQGQRLDSTPRLFFELEWPNGISIDGDSGTNTQGKLGFYMTPWIDDQTFKAYCPTQEYYYSSNPIFRAMREVVGVDTEGLYVAKKDGFCDFVLVKESLIKQIWFYKENGQHIQPNDNTISGKQVQFYWPASTDSPFIKKSDQAVYTLKRADELTCGDTTLPESSGQGSNGARTNFPPHDKRIGCVPVLR